MPPCTSSTAIIGCQCACDRVNRFLHCKLGVFNQYHIGRPENQAFTLTFDQWKTFLDIFKNANPANPQKFSGIRVYFASFIQTPHDMGNNYLGPQDVDKLVLIFVPTVANPAGAHDDVQSMYYALINGVGQLLNNPTTVADSRMDTASNWVRHYQQALIPLLQADGRSKDNAAFVETKSMRYPWSVIFGDSTDCGIYGFMQNMHDNPPTAPEMVDGINIRVACYRKGEPFSYQLSLVLDLHQVEDGQLSGSGAAPTPCPPTPVGTPEHDTGAPGDTGFPCPPDTGCSNGVTLPAS